jgi:hypothetical protein
MYVQKKKVLTPTPAFEKCSIIEKIRKKIISTATL